MVDRNRKSRLLQLFVLGCTERSEKTRVNPRYITIKLQILSERRRFHSRFFSASRFNRVY